MERHDVASQAISKKSSQISKSLLTQDISSYTKEEVGSRYLYLT